MPVQIDTHALVSPKAALSDGVEVGAYAIIHSGSRIGRDCKIDCYAAIGGAPQDLKYAGEPTTLTIGDRVVVREFVTLNRGTTATGKTTIGNDCLFMTKHHG